MNEYLYAKLSVDQTSSLGSGSWFEFDSSASFGTAVTLAASGSGQQNGVITLHGGASGRTFEIFTHCRVNINEGVEQHGWFDNETGLPINDDTGETAPIMVHADNATTDAAEMTGCVFVLTVGASISRGIRLQKLTDSNLTQRRRYSNVLVRELTDEYFYATMSADSIVNLGSGTNYPFDVSASNGSSVSLSSGVFTILANKVYEIHSHLRMVINEGVEQHAWFNDTTGVRITDDSGQASPEMLHTDNAATDACEITGGTMIYTPSSQQLIALKKFSDSTLTNRQKSSQVLIKVIG